MDFSRQSNRCLIKFHRAVGAVPHAITRNVEQLELTLRCHFIQGKHGTTRRRVGIPRRRFLAPIAIDICGTGSTTGRSRSTLGADLRIFTRIFSELFGAQNNLTGFPLFQVSSQQTHSMETRSIPSSTNLSQQANSVSNVMFHGVGPIEHRPLAQSRTMAQIIAERQMQCNLMMRDMSGLQSPAGGMRLEINQ